MPKVLITGVNGFLASHMCEKCLAEGLDVIGLCRDPKKIDLSHKNLKLITGDILDVDTIENAMIGCDIVIHIAGWSSQPNVSQDLAWKTNVEGTENMLMIAKKLKIKKFIFFSSIAVYGLNKSALIDETAETPFINETYTDSKITAEKIVRSYGVTYIIIRPGCIYGPKGKGWTIGIINQLKAGIKMLGKDEGLINYGFINNFVEGVWLSIINENIINETFNISDGTPITYNDYYLAYAKMLGIQKLPRISDRWIKFKMSKFIEILRIIFKKPVSSKHSEHLRFSTSYFSIEKAKKLLHYNPSISFEEGIKQTEFWLKENKFLD